MRIFIISSFLAAASFLISACDKDEEELPDIDCAAVTPVAYAQVRLIADCTRCHASTLTGDDREEAPADINFDTYLEAKTHAELGAHEVFEGEMPPDSSPTEDVKQEFYAWALCGTPQ